MRAKKYIVASFLFCFILFGITVCASAKDQWRVSV